MDDKELLELAAKAAGMQLWFDENGVPWSDGDKFVWNPLDNDGERYRLIAKLRMHIDFAERTVCKRFPDGRLIQEFWGGECGDEAHAVLRVAAAIAEQQRQGGV